jgi:small subunit ribosomal protein S9
MSVEKYHYAVGRRKTSTAQVRLYSGKGDNIVNGKKLEEFCAIALDAKRILTPLTVTNTENDYHFNADVKGGGTTGQISAIKLGIARALVKSNETYKPILKENDLMTRDPRMKERKKPYTRGARRGKQFSKR